MRGTVKTPMIKLQGLKPWILALSFVLSAEIADAASFGKMKVLSTLGQPLLAEIDLVNVTPDDLLGMSAKIASAEMFSEANVERSPALDSVKLVIDKRENGQPFIRVSSAQAISLSSLNLLVEVNWASGRLVRDYPVLLNPPKSVASASGAGAVSPPGFVNQTPPPSVEGKEKEPSAPAVESPKPIAPPAQVANSASPQPAAPAPAPEPSREESTPPTALPAGATSPERSSTNEKITKAVDSQAKPHKVVKVKNGDTLTNIAAKLHPPRGMLEQTMVAVFEANRQAFIKDNVNRIRAGSSLEIPNAAEIAAVPSEEASKRLKLMAKDFDAYRGRLASAAAARPVASTSAKAPVTGKMEGAADDAATPVKPGANDVLKLSRNAEGKKTEKSGRGEEAKTDKALEKSSEKGKANSAVEDKLREEAIVRENQLKEARDRAAILEKDVGQMRKLLQEKEELARKTEIENAKKAEEQKKADAKQKAEEQKRAASKMMAPVTLPEAIKPVLTEEQKDAARKEAQVSKEAAAKKEADNKPAEEAPAKVADAGSVSKAPEASAPEAKVVGEASEKDAKETDQEKKESIKEEDKPVAPLGRPDKKPALPETPETSSSVLSMLTEHPLAIAGGLAAGVLIGWLGLTALRRRREQLQDALFEPDPIDPISHGVTTPEAESVPVEQVKAVQIAETIKSFAEGDAAEELPSNVRQDVDPIEEADVYIAYGRNEQAEEILLKAIMSNPARLELIKKLLDLYAMEKRLPDYAQGFTKLQSLAPAGSTLLAAARRVGAELDPANPLYSMVAPSAAPAPAPAPVISPAAATPASLSGVDLDVTSGSVPAGGPNNIASAPASSLVPPVPGESATPPSSFGDIDLELAEKPAATPAATPAETPPAERGPEWQAVATQLDLARAYMEIEDKDNARDLLNEVIAKGDAAQRSEAERILAELGG